jgi:hypothetical protein
MFPALLPCHLSTSVCGRAAASAVGTYLARQSLSAERDNRLLYGSTKTRLRLDVALEPYIDSDTL